MKVVAGILAVSMAYLLTGFVVAGIVFMAGGEVQGAGAWVLLIGWVVSGAIFVKVMYRVVLHLLGANTHQSN